MQKLIFILLLCIHSLRAFSLDGCFVESITIDPIASGTIAGSYTRKDIEQHIGAKEDQVIVDPRLLHLDCIDGRDTHAGIRAPAGDSGIFCEGLTRYYMSSKVPVLRSHKEVFELTANFIRQLPQISPNRGFYMHTAEKQMANFLALMNISANPLEYDISTLPQHLHSEALEALIKPDYIGCGHMRNLISNPEKFGVNKTIIEWFIQSFFQFMWRQEPGGILIVPKLTEEYIKLAGAANEGATIIVTIDRSKLDNNSSCKNKSVLVKPLLTQNGKTTSVYVNHDFDSQSSFRNMVADYFAPMTNVTNMSSEDFVLDMKDLATTQLRGDVDSLAFGLPIYNVTLTLAPLPSNRHAYSAGYRASPFEASIYTAAFFVARFFKGKLY